MQAAETELEWAPPVRVVRADRSGGGSVPGPVPKPDTPTPADFRMLFTGDWEPIQIANLFLMDWCYRPKVQGGWENTQKSYADDLAQWWAFLDANGLRWDDARAMHLKEYTKGLQMAVSPRTSRRFSTSTVQRRVGTVENLYAWAFREGYIADRIERVLVEDTGIGIGPGKAFLPHLGTATTKKAKRPKGRHADNDARPMQPAVLGSILDRLGPPIFDTGMRVVPFDQDDLPRRNRLMAEAAYHTGMRAFEVTGIRLSRIEALKPSLDPAQPFQSFFVEVVTKGGRTRKVTVPSFMLLALLDYASNEREAAIAEAEELAVRNGVTFRRHDWLFVNGMGTNGRDLGRPTSPTTASQAFTDVVLALGHTVTVTGFQTNPETGEHVLDEDGVAVEVQIVKPAHTFHDLRHTYAVSIYSAEVRRGNREPWERLRVLLGHASADTTRNTYLRHVNVDEAALTDATMLRLRMDLDGVR
ncbi:MAG: tyrosine-type recombinase/integrase [Methylobacterium mesophilicum]|nr:tyrosine-type recombinase/integrase [Methylobacterium mesophilicum]